MPADFGSITTSSWIYSIYANYTPDQQDQDIELIGNPYMFTGRRFDLETGLYYYRARYYNPYIGRFLQTDPIGYGDGMNWYNYCGNNPINYIDSSGLSSRWWDDSAEPYVVWQGYERGDPCLVVVGLMSMYKDVPPSAFNDFYEIGNTAWWTAADILLTPEVFGIGPIRLSTIARAFSGAGIMSSIHSSGEWYKAYVLCVKINKFWFIEWESGTYWREVRGGDDYIGGIDAYSSKAAAEKAAKQAASQYGCDEEEPCRPDIRGEHIELAED